MALNAQVFSMVLKTIATIVIEHAQLSDLSPLYSLSALLSLGVKGNVPR